MYKISLGINKTEIMKEEITAEEMIKRLGLEKKPKLNLYGVGHLLKRAHNSEEMLKLQNSLIYL